MVWGVMAILVHAAPALLLKIPNHSWDVLKLMQRQYGYFSFKLLTIPDSFEEKDRSQLLKLEREMILYLERKTYII